MRAFSLVLLVALAACTATPGPQSAKVSPTLRAEDISSMNAFATSVLNGLQEISFAEGREFCGFILSDGAGGFAATPARRGTLASCDPGYLTADVVASYHTHGAFTPFYNNEIPSSEDLLGDFSVGIDGYVSTPSGRIWRVSHRDRRAFMLCGPGCVLSDPRDDPRAAGRIPAVLSLDDIYAME